MTARVCPMDGCDWDERGTANGSPPSKCGAWPVLGCLLDTITAEPPDDEDE